MNRAWHKSHPMPRLATMPQRVAWHLAHQRQCGCREIPASVQHLIDAKAAAGRRPRSAEPSGAARRGKKA